MKSPIIPDAKSRRNGGTFASHSLPAERKPRKLKVAGFSLQPTESWPNGAPQRETFVDDGEFNIAVRLYRSEWREEYECGDAACTHRDCPQHFVPELNLDDARSTPSASTAQESISQELQRLAKEADAWAKLRGWTRSKFCEQFKTLTGDRKTFGELCDKAPAGWERQPTTWIAAYRRLPQALREYEQRHVEAPLLELDHVLTFTDALMELRRQTNEQRGLLVEGVRGSGKTSLLTQMRAVLGEERVIMIQGRESWSSFPVMLEHWLKALGKPVDENSLSAARLQEKVADELRKAGDAVIAVDEFHCIPGRGLNALRDWINDAHAAATRVHFVFAAIPHHWDNLTGRFVHESTQLTRRLSDRIELRPPDAAECLRLLGQWVSLDLLGNRQEEAGNLLAAKAAQSCSRSYVRDVRANAHKIGTRLDWERLKTIAAAVAHKNR